MLAKNKTDKRVVWCGSRPSLLMALEPRILYDGAAAAVIADAAVATDHLPQQDTDVAAHAATDRKQYRLDHDVNALAQIWS